MNGHSRGPEAQPRITREEALDRAARAWAEAERLHDHEAGASRLRNAARTKDQAGS